MSEASERDDLHALQPGAQEVSLPIADWQYLPFQYAFRKSFE